MPTRKRKIRPNTAKRKAKSPSNKSQRGGSNKGGAGHRARSARRAPRSYLARTRTDKKEVRTTEGGSGGETGRSKPKPFLRNMTAVQMRDELTKLGHNTKGRKDELMKRLQEARETASSGDFFPRSRSRLQNKWIKAIKKVKISSADAKVVISARFR
jgi:hypothetical protein